MPSFTEKRTQVYLTAEQHRAAMTLAKKRGVSLAGMVREALAQYLAKEAERDGASWEEDPVLSAIGSLELAERDRGETLDEAIDATVYDEEG